MNRRSAMSDRERVSCTVLLGTFALLIFNASPTFSQQPSKPIRVGVLATGFEPSYAAQDRGLVAGLRDHGYIEGKTSSSNAATGISMGSGLAFSRRSLRG